ncbi:MAG: hypothetical protein Q8R26_03340 [bacterium]|nr:hypothetical protein [bacterium]
MNKLRFYLNKKLDERMTEEFLNVRGGGIDFGVGIVKIHPRLKSAKSLKEIAQREKAIRVYFDNYYQIYKTAILHKLERVQDVWRKEEQKYIAITEDFFGGFRFPKGKYIAYASIINCNPRFLELKTFQFFYKKSLADAIYTITHELLHFIFFDFIEKKLKKEIKHLSEDQLWDLSEIFNIIVLKSPRYRHIVNQKFVIPYPDHRRYINKFKKAYKNSQNAEEFIRRGITIISVKK